MFPSDPHGPVGFCCRVATIAVPRYVSTWLSDVQDTGIRSGWLLPTVLYRPCVHLPESIRSFRRKKFSAASSFSPVGSPVAVAVPAAAHSRRLPAWLPVEPLRPRLLGVNGRPQIPLDFNVVFPLEFL